MTRRFNRRFTVIALIVGIFASFLPLSTQPAQAAPINRRQLWATDGIVRTSVQRGNTLYIGGNFNYVAPMVRNLALLQSTGEGKLAVQAPQVNNTIFAIEPDGYGGWFIGGNFSSVDGLARNGIAHILPDGTVNPTWNPNPDVNSIINALKRSGNVLYVGGNFATIGGQTRPFLAALNTTGTGTATAWNPSAGGNVNGQVFSLAVSGSTLYVGGRFTFIGGQTRNRAAAFTLPSNTANSWNPNVAGAGTPTVFTISISGSTAYLGGQFDTVGGQARNALAATNATTGAVTAWAPYVFGGTIYTIIATASVVYVGGSHQFIDSGGGGVAAINPTTGELIAGWQADTTGDPVYGMALVGNTLYIGGNFSRVAGYGGIVRYSIAALNATDGGPLTWNPRAQFGAGLAGVNALAVQNGVVAAGGTIDLIGGVATEDVAAININGGEAYANFRMDTDEDYREGVYALEITADKNTLFMGGDFDAVSLNGSALQTRINLASINLINNTVNPWNPGTAGGLQNDVYALAISGNTLYVGGNFGTLGGVARDWLGAVNAITGTTTTWNPDPNSAVFALDISGNTLYVGGQFGNFNNGTTARNNAAAFDLTTGNITSWNPNMSDRVEAIEATPSVVYLGGWFSSAGPNIRSCAAAVNTTTGAATAWNPNLNCSYGGVYAIAIGNSGTIYLGGKFSQSGTTARSGLAAFNAAGVLQSWNPGADATVLDLRTYRGEIFVGGQFATLNGFRWLGFGSLYESASAQETIGVFRPSNSTFYLRNANSSGPATLSIKFGVSTDLPITGDWDGDGVDTIGLYRPSNSTFYLSNTASGGTPAVVYLTAAFGAAGDIPVVGDWNGDGVDSIGVFRPSTGRFLLRDANVAGPATYSISFGGNGDLPLAGNWEGVGGDTPGLWRPSNRVFYLTNTLCTNCAASANLTFAFGTANDLPFVGDWDGDGKTGVGLFRPSNTVMYLRNTLTAGNPNLSFPFGGSTDKPVAGHWVSGPFADEPVAPSFVPKQ